MEAQGVARRALLRLGRDDDDLECCRERVAHGGEARARDAVIVRQERERGERAGASIWARANLARLARGIVVRIERYPP